MLTALDELPGSVIPSQADTELAQESSRKLAKLLETKNHDLRLRIESATEPEETVAVPLSAFHLLAEILAEMARGNAVTLIQVNAELSTEQAADLLNVSQTYLIDLLQTGRISHRKVGNHLRVLLRDLMTYKHETDTARLKDLEELSALDQELGGMGYGR